MSIICFLMFLKSPQMYHVNFLYKYFTIWFPKGHFTCKAFSQLVYQIMKFEIVNHTIQLPIVDIRCSGHLLIARNFCRNGWNGQSLVRKPLLYSRHLALEDTLFRPKMDISPIRNLLIADNQIKYYLM